MQLEYLDTAPKIGLLRINPAHPRGIRDYSASGHADQLEIALRAEWAVKTEARELVHHSTLTLPKNGP
jgi:hypothetical protein